MRNTSTKINFVIVMNQPFAYHRCAAPLPLVTLHRLRLRFRTLDLTCGLTEPGFETRLAESRVVAGNECALAHLHAVVARVRVSDNLARILACGQTPPDEFIETKLFRPPYFNGAIHWWAHRDPAYRTGDIVGRHGLDEHRWQAHLVAVGGKIGDALDEFEELRRADN